MAFSNKDKRLGENREHNKNATRSRTWCPLVYPRSAFTRYCASHQTTPNVENEFFPLHWAVLTATFRELLVLDQTLDKTSLRVKTELFLFTDGQVDASEDKKTADTNVISAPRYQAHSLRVKTELFLFTDGQVDASEDKKTADTNVISAPRYQAHLSGWKALTSTNYDSEHKKQKNGKTNKGTSTSGQKKGLNTKKRKRKTQSQDKDVMSKDIPIADAPVAAACIENDKLNSPTAEDLVHQLLSRTFEETTSNWGRVSGTTEPCGERPPRKVSNADGGSVPSAAASSVSTVFWGIDSSTAIVAQSDVSRFVMPATAPSGLLQLHVKTKHNHELPQFLEASIFTESNLRDVSLDICRHLFQSVDTSTLSLFLGYRSPQNDRSKSLIALADYLFDVSHAMFAWEQTEREVQNGELTQAQVDARVQKSLFDARALKKIGGMEAGSLLPQAISIARLAVSRVSWEAHARTDAGQAMLEHFQNSQLRLKVGKSRRPLKRQTTLANGSNETNIQSKNTLSEEKARLSPVTGKDSARIGREDAEPTVAKKARTGTGTLPVQLKRSSLGSSWGVLLSKEGGRCVVARDTFGGHAGTCQLCKGDIILSAKNEKGTVAQHVHDKKSMSPASASFQDVVDLFKTSVALKLQVQRDLD